MQGQVKNALVLLFAVAALLAVLASLTDAASALSQANPVFFALAAAFFLLSILIWLVGWAMLLKSSGVSSSRSMPIGFSCFFASLTPVQIGADALRSIKLKEVAAVPYSETISASMVVKGLKFFFIALLASFAFFSALFNPALSAWIKAAMLSGFAVVAIATLLFLLPLHKKIGLMIAGMFRAVAKKLHMFGRLADYFQKYSIYLQKQKKSTIALIALLSLVSLLLEFAAFLSCFLSANTMIPLYSATLLFSLLIILERTPFLPQGIGAVEAVGFAFLSMQSFTAAQLSLSQIAAIIILFDSVRLIIPTIASMAVYGMLFAKK